MNNCRDQTSGIENLISSGFSLSEVRPSCSRILFAAAPAAAFSPSVAAPANSASILRSFSRRACSAFIMFAFNEPSTGLDQRFHFFVVTRAALLRRARRANPGPTCLLLKARGLIRAAIGFVNVVVVIRLGGRLLSRLGVSTPESLISTTPI